MKETTPGAIHALIDLVAKEEGTRLKGDDLRTCLLRGSCAFYAVAYRQYEGMLRTIPEAKECLRLAQKMCRDIAKGSDGRIDRLRFKAATLGAYRMMVETERLLV